MSSQLTPAMVNFAYDYTGDGWPDVLISHGRAMSLYVNPRGDLRRWDKYDVLPTISSEIAVFKDIDGDKSLTLSRSGWRGVLGQS